MLEYIKYYAGKLNETVFTVIFFASSVLFYNYAFGLGDEGEKLRVVALLLFRVALFLFTGDMFIKFLNGLGRSVNKEIFDEHNTSVAIVIAGFWIALSIAIAVTV